MEPQPVVGGGARQDGALAGLAADVQTVGSLVQTLGQAFNAFAEEVNVRLAALEAAPPGSSPSAAGAASAERYAPSPEACVFHPFQVETDPVSGDYSVFVPDGSVVYEGEELPTEGVDDDGMLTFPSATEPFDLYGHVRDSGGGRTLVVDDESDAGGDLYTFHIARVDAGYDDESVDESPMADFDFLGGALHVGGGRGGFPAVFDPVYDDGDESESEGGGGGRKVTGFTNCYFQWGGFTVDMGDQDSPIDDGYVVLSIATDGTSGNPPSGELVGYGTLSELAHDQASLDTVLLPLWRMEGGRPDLDMRNMPYVGPLEFIPAAGSDGYEDDDPEVE